MNFPAPKYKNAPVATTGAFLCLTTERGLAALFDDLNQVRDRVDHAADRRSILQLTGFVHLVQAQANQGCALFGETS